jgi:hypothetical protein
MLHFTRLRPDLTVLSDDCIATMSFDGVSVTPTSAGWLIAAHGNGGGTSGIFLYALDRIGRARGTPQVLSVPRNGGDPWPR